MKTADLANLDLTAYIRAGDAVMWGQAVAARAGALIDDGATLQCGLGSIQARCA